MTLLFSRTSLKYLESLDKKTRERILSAIEKLLDNGHGPGFAQGDIKKMKGRKIHNIFRLRIESYRVLFQWEKAVVRILDIDNRQDIYK